MNTAQVIHFPKPSLVQEEIVNTQENDDGYTPLPNFICDEGYLAVLTGDAIKCLVFLNRHINGFHIDQKSMGESLVMKITGIKDNRTIRKYMSELAKYQLVKILKENGKSNKYSITFNDRLPLKPVARYVTGHISPTNCKPVACHVPSTSNAVTFHATSPVACHVPTTSDMACHPVKEIYLKENIKNKKKDFPVDNSKSEMFGDSIEYHPDDSNPYSLRELANVYLIKTDFSAQAKIIHPDFTDEQILVEIKNFAQWSTAQQKRTAQAWMNNWIYRIQKFTSPKSKSPGRPKSSPGQKKLSDSQIDMFSKKLCNFDDFASMFSNVGETQKQFESRISKKLRDPENIKSWATYLRDVGFAGNLGDFV